MRHLHYPEWRVKFCHNFVYGIHIAGYCHSCVIPCGFPLYSLSSCFVFCVVCLFLGWATGHLITHLTAALHQVDCPHLSSSVYIPSLCHYLSPVCCWIFSAQPYFSTFSSASLSVPIHRLPWPSFEFHSVLPLDLPFVNKLANFLPVLNK